jgi:hypothetical protein
MAQLPTSWTWKATSYEGNLKPKIIAEINTTFM